MGKIISASLELTKLTSSKFKTQKGTECLLIPLNQPGIFASEKGTVFLNTTIYENDQLDNYGNSHAVAISQTKEQREAGEKRVYLGNGKTVGGGQPSNVRPQDQQHNVQAAQDDNDSLPF